LIAALLAGLTVTFWSLCAPQGAPAPAVPDGFVDLAQVAPSILVEARYAGSHNFVGRPIQGYRTARCYLTRQAASQLATIQDELRRFALTLKVYDCYRPQRAVADFADWTQRTGDVKMKAEFYPRADKRDLFKDGYIAHRSGHSRGSTVDLTLVPLPAPAQAAYRGGQPLLDCVGPRARRFDDNSLDMGTGYDCLDPAASTVHPAVGPDALRNRLLLKSIMEKYGFKNYDKEWWHYTLEHEPFSDTYFDFEVQ
jgi:D-alanyl-D-alanine dipeptidase